MRDADEKTVWGQVEKIGKGTKANYDARQQNTYFLFQQKPTYDKRPTEKIT